MIVFKNAANGKEYVGEDEAKIKAQLEEGIYLKYVNSEFKGYVMIVKGQSWM